MSLSLRSRFWRAFLHKTIKEQRLTIAERRAGSVKNAGFMNRVPKGVEVDTFEIDGIHVAQITPSNTHPDKIILHLHGGGYVTGGLDSHQMMCILMAQMLKIKVLLPEYRLAPEHPFPAALNDSLNVYRWLLAQGTQPGDIIISGDSAGGGLSVATVLSLRDDGGPLPAAVVCMSPWADLTLKSQSHITKAKTEVLLKKEVLREWALCYTEDANLTNPLVSPVYADFHGFPPLLIQVGSEEILLDDARMLADKAKVDGLWHVWQALGDLIPENKKAFEEIGQFVQSRFGGNEMAG
jgi:monoterpene epsilon-lactone hydrolase